MKRRIYIEFGAAETRAACFIDDEPVRFFFGSARGDEHLPRPPMRGDVYLGRVRTVSKALDGAFIDIDRGRDAFLPLKKGARPPGEGALVEVIVRRPPIGLKGAVVALNEAKAGASTGADSPKPGAVGGLVDAAINAFVSVSPEVGAGGGDAEVVVDDAAAAKILRAYGARQVEIAEDLFETSGAEEALAASLERELSLDGGARLIFDETEGVAVIDVDSGAQAGETNRRLNDRVNLAAARAIPAEVSRRAIGGRVVVDFLPPSDRTAGEAVLAELKGRGSRLFKARYGKMSPDGLFDLTLPRADYSLLERASEPSGEDRLRAGRRFTTDWCAKAAIRALERALRIAPSARLTLRAGREISAYLASRPQWCERVAARFGARFDMIDQPQFGERAFDVVERR